MNLGFIVLVILASLLIGLSKGGLGGPVPVAFLTPLMSLIMPAAQAVALVLPLLLIGDVFALWIYWKTWDARQVRLMLPMAVIGIIMGGVLLITLSDTHQDVLLRRILGLFTLLVVIYKISSDRLKSLTYERRDWHGHVVGWAAGFGSALANVGAPPFTAYMLLQDFNPTIFIGTTTLFFAIVNALKLPITLRLLTWQEFIGVLWAFPVIPVGVWLGRRSLNFINPKAFERFMLVLLLGMSLFMLLSPGK